MEPIRENKERFYTPKEVSEQLKISTDLLRKWTEEFNIQTQWTQANNKGHRRFSKESLEVLLSIKQKIHAQNWSWDQVRSWRNGQVDAFVAYQEKSDLEKKLDRILENQDEQMELNKQLIQQIANLTGQLEAAQKKILNLAKVEQEKNAVIELLEQKTAEQETKTRKKWWKFGV